MKSYAIRLEDRKAITTVHKSNSDSIWPELWVKIRYESKSVYASETPFGWSWKVFLEHWTQCKYLQYGLARPSKTIHNSTWMVLEGHSRPYQNSYIVFDGLEKPFKTIQMPCLRHKLMRNRSVSESTLHFPENRTVSSTSIIIQLYSVNGLLICVEICSNNKSILDIFIVH